MEPGFYDLRRAIYADDTELKRFRQVIVNSVLSTDMEDIELKYLRMTRWEKTFSSGTYHVTPEDINRKATIVLEHLMQASDIFHTMQPWIVYEKWCSRDFEEKYIAYKQGRTKEDPSLTWYKQEMDLFDNYVIPLSMQLKDCDAFVVSSDEYLVCEQWQRTKYFPLLCSYIPWLCIEFRPEEQKATGCQRQRSCRSHAR